MLARLVPSKSISPPPIPLLRNAQLHTLALRQRDPRLLAPDDEDVALARRELVVDRVLDVHDVEASVVTLAVRDDADTAHVAPAGRHGDHAGVEADEVFDLAWKGRSIGLVRGVGEGRRVYDLPVERLIFTVSLTLIAGSGKRILHYMSQHSIFHQNIGPTSDRQLHHLRASIMRNQEWYPSLAQLHPLHLPELVRRLLFRDAVHGEATLGIVDKAEVLARLLDRDDVHVAGWVGWVGAHFAVDFDEALHDDRFGFAGVEGVFEARTPFQLVSCHLPRTPGIAAHTDSE